MPPLWINKAIPSFIMPQQVRAEHFFHLSLIIDCICLYWGCFGFLERMISNDQSRNSFEWAVTASNLKNDCSSLLWMILTQEDIKEHCKRCCIIYRVKAVQSTLTSRTAYHPCTWPLTAATKTPSPHSLPWNRTSTFPIWMAGRHWICQPVRVTSTVSPHSSISVPSRTWPNLRRCLPRCIEPPPMAMPCVSNNYCTRNFYQYLAARWLSVQLTRVNWLESFWNSCEELNCSITLTT